MKEFEKIVNEVVKENPLTEKKEDQQKPTEPAPTKQATEDELNEVMKNWKL